MKTHAITKSEGAIKVSVVIPNYNKAKYLRKTIESIWAQDYQGNYECVVVDDGSTDSSFDVIMDLFHRTPVSMKVVFLESNRGVAHALNLGVQLAEGEYISFLGADDTYPPNRLLHHMSFLEENSHVDGCFGDFIREECGDTRIFLSRPKRGFFPTVEGMLTYEDFFELWTLTVRKDCLLRIGGFNEKLMFPEEILPRLVHACSIHYLPGVCVHLFRECTKHKGHLGYRLKEYEAQIISSVDSLLKREDIRSSVSDVRRVWTYVYLQLGWRYHRILGDHKRSLFWALRAMFYNPRPWVIRASAAIFLANMGILDFVKRILNPRGS